MGKQALEKRLLERKAYGLNFDQWSYLIGWSGLEPKTTEDAVEILTAWQHLWGEDPPGRPVIAGVERVTNDAATERFFRAQMKLNLVSFF